MKLLNCKLSSHIKNWQKSIVCLWNTVGPFQGFHPRKAKIYIKIPMFWESHTLTLLKFFVWDPQRFSNGSVNLKPNYIIAVQISSNTSICAEQSTSHLIAELMDLTQRAINV